MMQLQSQIKLAESQATANEGLGIERLSRVKENEALAEERKAQAVKDEDAAILDLLKALKEIAGLDLQHMQQLLQMHAMVKGQEAENNTQNTTTQPIKVSKTRKKPNTLQSKER